MPEVVVVWRLCCYFDSAEPQIRNFIFFAAIPRLHVFVIEPLWFLDLCTPLAKKYGHDFGNVMFESNNMMREASPVPWHWKPQRFLWHPPHLNRLPNGLAFHRKESRWRKAYSREVLHPEQRRCWCHSMQRWCIRSWTAVFSSSGLPITRRM